MTQYLKLKNKANLCNCLGFIAPVCCRVSMWWHQVALCWKVVTSSALHQVCDHHFAGDLGLPSTHAVA